MTSLQEYFKALKEEPESEYILASIADSFYYLGKYEDCVRFYKKAIEANPNSPRAHEAIAETYYYNGNY